jgi:hypothetical protein
MNGIKKIIIVITTIIILFIIVLLISAWKMGIFSSVTIIAGERGPYYLVADKHSSSYEMIHQKSKLIQLNLAKKNITPLCRAGIITGNPLQATLTEMNAFAACMIKDSAGIDTPYVLHKIEKRWILIATIEANPAIAPFKAYPALVNRIRRDNLQQDTIKEVIELYNNDQSLEIELPVLKNVPQ